MNLERVEKIAEAVLYEGYMLYPYRPSSVKNRQRWNFGVLYPRAYCEQQCGAEAWTMQTECLVKSHEHPQLTIKVRFLQVIRRSVGKLRASGTQSNGVEPEFDLVDRLQVGDHTFQPWQEAVEQEVTSAGLDPALLSSLRPVHFVLPSGKHFEYLCDADGQAVGVIVREREMLAGSVQFESERLHDEVMKVTVRVRNLMFLEPSQAQDREAALMYSLISAHTILGIERGEFLSLLDPPQEFAALAPHCRNIGTWPVLVGEQAEAVLSSPIILYDQPQIAPESAGNLFDATEIDEILSLRILTLTDEEKREMRQSDERGREILERTESMPEEQFMKLHGVLRGLAPIKQEARDE